jgi:hypothetical protein
MSFKDNLKVFLSYLKQFPSPTFLEKHSNLKTSYFELKDNIRELEKENKILKERLHLKGAFSRHNGAYFFETPDGRQEPFCSRCWDVESRLTPLRLEDEDTASCPRCTDRH